MGSTKVVPEEPPNSTELTDTEPSKKQVSVDDIIVNHLGAFGRYQLIQFILLCTPSIFVAFHVMSWALIAAPLVEICEAQNATNMTACMSDGDIFLPAMRWEMEGDKSWIKATVQALYYVGQMIGSYFCGIMGDKIGRKKVFFLALIIQMSCGLLLSVAHTWWMFAILKAATGFSQPGIFGVAIVMAMELVGSQYRSVGAVTTGIFTAVGEVILAVMAYFITDYRVLHLTIAVPSLLFISYWWLVPESARWLIAKKRYEEANTILCKAARLNRSYMPDKWWMTLEESPEKTKNSSFGTYDLVRTPQMRKRTLACFFIWPVCTGMYYGLTLKSNLGGGNLYINLAVSGAVEIPAMFTVYFLIDRIGRKALGSSALFVAGIALLTTMFLGHSVPVYVTTALVTLAKGSVTVAYTTMYTWTPELIPTVLRNTAVGCCSMIARIGAISSSFLAMWLVHEYGRWAMVVPFSACSLMAACIALIFLPETRGKSMPESISEVEGTNI